MSQFRMTEEQLAAHNKRIKGGLKSIVDDLKKPSKYGNKKTVIDGQTFDSKREAKCYSELKLRERAGEISDLKTQVSFGIEINGKHVCRYIADFVYQQDGKRVVADAKGHPTPVYRLKKRLMFAVHRIEILEL